MGNAFAGRIYVVAATKNGQIKFWAAATPCKAAAALAGDGAAQPQQQTI